jgi:ABC-type multidrug transport system ATPase subunit
MHGLGGEPQPAASVRGLRKRFGYRDVLRGIDLDVPRGSRFVVSGPNGAGKSTLLRILTTQWHPTTGEVRVLGHDARKEGREIRSRIGVVFHDSFLRRELTLEENIRFVCDLHGLRYRTVADRAAELLERFGLAHRVTDRVGTFSQGMVRRANIVRSLVPAPELWILDEPFSGLDVEGQGLLESWIREFSAKGGTVVLVTHQPALGARIGTGWARIEDGLLSARGDGPPPIPPEAAGQEGEA